MTLRPAIFDRNVLALDKSGLVQSLPECTDEWRGAFSRRSPDETDNRHHRLLRTSNAWCGEKTTSHRANESPSVHHWITVSTRTAATEEWQVYARSPFPSPGSLTGGLTSKVTGAPR